MHYYGKKLEIYLLNSVTINQTSYWVGVGPIDRDRSDLWIGILNQENDILRELQRRQMTNISISVSILLLGLLIAIIMVRKYRKRLTREQITALEGDELETRIRGMIDKGENKVLEFKSTLRMNLNTNQPGKEIEIAWLKTANAFLNSEGGILFFGVMMMVNFLALKPIISKMKTNADCISKNLSINISVLNSQVI